MYASGCSGDDGAGSSFLEETTGSGCGLLSADPSGGTFLRVRPFPMLLSRVNAQVVPVLWLLALAGSVSVLFLPLLPGVLLVVLLCRRR